MNQPLETYQDEIYRGGIGGATPVLPAKLDASLADLSPDALIRIH